MKIISIFFVVILIAAFAVCNKDPVEARSQSPPTSKPCHSPFGTVIGSTEITQHLNIQPAHLNKNFTTKITCESNCYGDYDSNENAVLSLVEGVFGGPGGFYDKTCDLATPACPSQVFLGMKWQCVLKGRDALLRKYGATFASIDYAVDIFNLTEVTQYGIIPSPTSSTTNSSSKPCQCASFKKPFWSFANNETKVAPQVGDLIIYNTVGPGMAPTGHVAAIVRVDAESKFIDVIEDNWSNAPWPASQRDYSRRVDYFVDEVRGGVQVLSNPPYHVLGWKRVGV